MPDVIADAVSKLPRPVITALQNTPVDHLYQYSRYLTVDVREIRLTKGSATESLYAPKRSHLYRILGRGDEYEPQLTAAISDEFDTEDTFYDIGSQFGYFTTLAKACGVPSSQIHGFEANDYHYRVLNRTHATDDAFITQAYVGERTTTEMLALETYDGDDPNVVKIDVEGYEYGVLRGMGEKLDGVRCLFVEIHPRFLARTNDTPRDVFELLRDEGFELTATEHREENAWESLSDAELPQDHAYLLRAKR
ncbi:FkbM family methyltransferase [Haladaptatus sp. DYF46]|uniref:FkbM family methyltransferase n=1 Tax=Haladaptatus sp. DYF46 TaxID=2886041 RepID=UPI001E3AFF77|nr:FkbM family methyltransferase [Haladaptatus sp. DYF46]